MKICWFIPLLFLSGCAIDRPEFEPIVVPSEVSVKTSGLMSTIDKIHEKVTEQVNGLSPGTRAALELTAKVAETAIQEHLEEKAKKKYEDPSMLGIAIFMVLVGVMMFFVIGVGYRRGFFRNLFRPAPPRESILERANRRVAELQVHNDESLTRLVTSIENYVVTVPPDQTVSVTVGGNGAGSAGRAGGGGITIPNGVTIVTSLPINPHIGDICNLYRRREDGYERDEISVMVWTGANWTEIQNSRAMTTEDIERYRQTMISLDRSLDQMNNRVSQAMDRAAQQMDQTFERVFGSEARAARPSPPPPTPPPSPAPGPRPAHIVPQGSSEMLRLIGARNTAQVRNTPASPQPPAPMQSPIGKIGGRKLDL